MKKLALIGCGGIGEYHLGNFMKLTDLVELAGFCDVILERAEGFVKKAGSGKAFSSFIKMYDEIQPDMVFICVPPTVHGEIEFETIARGIPFFVEKPLSLDADLAREMLRQVESKKLVAASGFQCRYDGINDHARAFIDAHPIVTIAASRVGGIPQAPWWRNKFASGGQLVEQTIHQMDILRYLMRVEPDTVYSVPTRGFIDQTECPGYFTDDVSTTLITFKNGVTCTMMTGCYSLNGASWDSKMTFGARSARMDYYLINKVALYGVAPADKAAEVAGTIAGDGTQRKSDKEEGVVYKSVGGFGVNCDRTFIEAAISGDGSKIRSPYGDAYKSVLFTLACNRSMESGQPVKVIY